jgi:hypothetical protein
MLSSVIGANDPMRSFSNLRSFCLFHDGLCSSDFGVRLMLICTVSVPSVCHSWRAVRGLEFFFID